jgi:hypothetical protein
MVEKTENIAKSKEMIELENLISKNPLYDIDYSELNLAVISDSITLIENLNSITKDKNFIETKT